MIQYNWVISAVEYAPTENELEKVIKAVHWRYQATEGEISVEAYGSQAMAEPDPENYTPYEEITEAMIIEWLEGSMDVEPMKEALKNLIEDVKNPKIIIDNPFKN